MLPFVGWNAITLAHSFIVPFYVPNLQKKVARKLVLMEQDLERSEEKVELAERFVEDATNCFFLILLI